MTFFSYFDKFIEQIHTHIFASSNKKLTPSVQKRKQNCKIHLHTPKYSVNREKRKKEVKFYVQTKSVAHCFWFFFWTLSNWIAVFSRFNWFHHQEIENQGEFILHMNEKQQHNHCLVSHNSLFVGPKFHTQKTSTRQNLQ